MPKPTDNIEVLREDQEKINKFSRLNGQLTEVDQMIEQRTKIVKDIADANEIVEELQITDDEAPVHFKIGECFFLQTCENMGDLIVAEQENLKAELAKHELNKKTIVDEMNGLKKQLYAKFGDQIHLERE
ncbi:Oidioi.mRNA.OKI2018_I69.XSR.g14021.t1.cds [Oikopleura dioica]|uniref:Prefoldin subunit 4 n=1 Tax=Oikopleura dioica TaxID=34765 RepID=A0ABN7SDH7_OIKDI|nr:Oidioi.mRNA.OKI2018_I69.XSR.g14021.t1.cds [Oikopleura dioica]